MSAWSDLPQGQDINFKKGDFYAAIASVSNDHSRADILKIAGDRGLQIFDYAEQGERVGLGPDPKSGYRYISIQAQATKDGSLPWSPGFPASLVAHYEVVRAWEAAPLAPGEQPLTPPTAPVAPPVGSSSSFPIIPVVVLLAAGGVATWWIWSRHQHHRPIFAFR